MLVTGYGIYGRMSYIGNEGSDAVPSPSELVAEISITISDFSGNKKGASYKD